MSEQQHGSAREVLIRYYDGSERTATVLDEEVPLSGR